MTPQIGTGDSGQTSLFSGAKVTKDDKRIVALGNADELNSFLGITLSLELEEETREILEIVSHMVFDVGAEIASEGLYTAENISDAEVQKMTDWILFLDEKLPDLNEFMLPSGTPSAEWLNLTRAVTRKLERSMFSLMKNFIIRPEVFHFINRLSRLLFSLERWENFKKSGIERKWEKGKTFPEIPGKKEQFEQIKESEVRAFPSIPRIESMEKEEVATREKQSPFHF